MTVDYINECWMNNREEHADGNELAERIGDINRRYHQLASNVDNNLANLEMLLPKWQQYNVLAEDLMTWIDCQKKNVLLFPKIASSGRIAEAINGCEVTLSYSLD